MIKYAFIFMLLVSFNAFGAEIVILRSDNQTIDIPVNNANTFVNLNVDSMKNAIGEINAKLTKNENESRRLATTLMQKYKADMQNGFRGVSLISTWDIKKLPAIVFDNGQYVYYGYNVRKAISLWEGKK